MHAGIKQETSLIVGLLAPRSVVPLVVCLDAPQDADAKVVNLAECCSLAGGIGKAGVETNVLSNGQGGFGRRANTLSVGNQGACSSDVFGDGFLCKDVFSSREGGLNEGRLAEDGEGNDDGGYVISLKYVLIRLASARILRVKVRLGD